jgi:hypothetical protein
MQLRIFLIKLSFPINMFFVKYNMFISLIELTLFFLLNFNRYFFYKNFYKIFKVEILIRFLFYIFFDYFKIYTFIY